MKRIIAQITVVGMMTFTAQARAREVSAAKDPSSVQGRTFISINDFQKILQGPPRMLSSEHVASVEAQSGSGSIAALQSMSSAEKEALYKKVLPLAQAETRALAMTVKALNGKLAAVKAERKALQAARLNKSSGDQMMQESLFSNLLEESNLEAKIAEAKRQVEEANVIILEYVKDQKQTQLVNVQHGDHQLWNIASNPTAESNENGKEVIALN